MQPISMAELLPGDHTTTYTLYTGTKIEYDPTRVLPPDLASEDMGYEGGVVINTLRFLAKDSHMPVNVLELGVGSGVGLVALLQRVRNKNNIHLFGIDIDPYCVDLTRRNIENVISDDMEKPTVEIIRADWNDETTWSELRQRKYQVILFNPPYLTRGTALLPGYENVPDHMVYTDDSDELKHYRNILPKIPDILAEEIGSAFISRGARHQFSQPEIRTIFYSLQNELGNTVYSAGMYLMDGDRWAHRMCIARSLEALAPHQDPLNIYVESGDLSQEVADRIRSGQI